MRALALLLLVGCGGGLSSDLEGIYTVATWTRNPTSCDAEGPPDSSPSPMLYIKVESFLGSEFLNVNNCTTQAECEMEANDDKTIHIGEFIFEKGSDSKGWTSRNAFAFENMGECTGGMTDLLMTKSSGGVRIERRHFDAVPFPADSGEDECPEDKVEAASTGSPCENFEVVTATFVTDF